MKSKSQARLRRAAKTKARLKLQAKPRLIVYRSNKHIYAQIAISSLKGDVILASSSTKDVALKSSLQGSKTEQASQVGAELAARAKQKEITEVAFDRSGYSYHGRVKAIAEAARAHGLIF